MKRKSDQQFVHGEGRAQVALSMLQTSTVNSVWIASGKSIEEGNNQLCTFSLMKIEHPLPC